MIILLKSAIVDLPEVVLREMLPNFFTILVWIVLYSSSTDPTPYRIAHKALNVVVCATIKSGRWNSAARTPCYLVHTSPKPEANGAVRLALAIVPGEATLEAH